MRYLRCTAFLAFLWAPVAQASELKVYCPALVNEAMREFAQDFAKETGIAVSISTGPMGKLVETIQAASPDVVILPPDLMDSLDRQGGVQAGTRTPLVRVEIGLAVRAGAEIPDISTDERLHAALLKAGALTYTKPGPPRFSREADIIDALLKRLPGVHAMPALSGSGVAFLAAGNADMAMQVVPEILATKGLKLVGPLPPDLGAHIDVVAAVFARSGDAQAAQAFIRYVSRPQSLETWKAQGIDQRFQSQ